MHLPPQLAIPHLPELVALPVARVVVSLAVVLESELVVGPAEIEPTDESVVAVLHIDLPSWLLKSPLHDLPQQSHLGRAARVDAGRPRLYRAPNGRDALSAPAGGCSLTGRKNISPVTLSTTERVVNEVEKGRLTQDASAIEQRPSNARRWDAGHEHAVPRANGRVSHDGDPRRAPSTLAWPNKHLGTDRPSAEIVERRRRQVRDHRVRRAGQAGGERSLLPSAGGRRYGVHPGHQHHPALAEHRRSTCRMVRPQPSACARLMRPCWCDASRSAR